MKIKQWAFLTPFIGSMVFFIFTTIAMFFYVGGTAFDPSLEKYDFFQNFFSDLGRTYVYDGDPNPISSILFILAATISGILLIPFYLNLSQISFRTEKKQKLAKTATFISIISSICAVVTGLIPPNVSSENHILAVIVGFIGTGLVCTIYGILFLDHESYPKTSSKLFLFYAVLLMVYILINIIFLDPNQANSFLIKVVAQKIIVYTNLPLISIQAILGYQWGKRYFESK